MLISVMMSYLSLGGHYKPGKTCEKEEAELRLRRPPFWCSLYQSRCSDSTEDLRADDDQGEKSTNDKELEHGFSFG